MNKVSYLNENARVWDFAHGADRPLQPSVPLGFRLSAVPATMPEAPEATTAPHIGVDPDIWTLIDKVACDPDLVAYVELQLLGYTQVDMPDERKDAIEKVGLPGVREGILQDTRMGEGNFAIALAACEQTVREEHELYRQRLPHNW